MQARAKTWAAIATNNTLALLTLRFHSLMLNNLMLNSLMLNSLMCSNPMLNNLMSSKPMLLSLSLMSSKPMLNSLTCRSLMLKSHTCKILMHNSPMRKILMHNRSLRSFPIINSLMSKSNSLSKRRFRPLICLFVPAATQQPKKPERVRKTVMQLMEESLLDDTSTGETTSPIDMEEPTHTKTVCSPRQMITG